MCFKLERVCELCMPRPSKVWKIWFNLVISMKLVSCGTFTCDIFRISFMYVLLLFVFFDFVCCYCAALYASVHEYNLSASLSCCLLHTNSWFFASISVCLSYDVHSQYMMCTVCTGVNCDNNNSCHANLEWLLKVISCYWKPKQNQYVEQ